MGKTLISQRRGKGTGVFKARSHRYVGRLCFRKYDESEKSGVINGTLINLVHCPGHSAPLAEIKYNNKEKILVSAPLGVELGSFVSSGAKADIKVGNVLPLNMIPDGAAVCLIESAPGSGPIFCNASGASAKIISKNDNKIIVELQSKKQRTFNGNCRAMIGVIAGGGRLDKPIVKAGNRALAMRARNKYYPQSKGVAMNAVAHPFGSGRGRRIGKSKTPSRFDPPGRRVGLIGARRTGRKKK